MVERARKWGFRGIKCHGFQAMPTRELCEAARAFRMPLLADVVGRAEVVDLLASQFPDVNFIIPHLGSFADDWRAHQRVIDQLVRYPNVYTDTSGVRRFDYIVEAIKRAGPRKVLFGSDGPWLHPGLELHKVRLLGLPPDQEALILGGNILRLLRQVRSEADPKDIRRARRERSSSAGAGVQAIEASSSLPPGTQPEYEL
jgi:predicted TIM-barrel fold metal-dependent hydrolase